MNANPPKIQNLTSLVEQRVRALIGELMVNNAALVVQVEALQNELAECRQAAADSWTPPEPEPSP